MRLAAPVLGALVLAGCGGTPAQHAEHRPFTPMSEPAHAAAPRGRWLTARLTSPTALRARPGGRALDRLGVRTEFGSRRGPGGDPPPARPRPGAPPPPPHPRRRPGPPPPAPP